YLIHWKGYEDVDDSWVPASHLEHAQDILREFHERRTPAKTPDRRITEKKRLTTTPVLSKEHISIVPQDDQKKDTKSTRPFKTPQKITRGGRLTKKVVHFSPGA